MTVKQLFENLPKWFFNTRWLMKYTKPQLPALILIVSVDAVLALMGVGTAIISKWIIDAATEGMPDSVLFNVFLFSAVAVFNLVISSAIGMLTVLVNEKLGYNIRKTIFKAILQAEWMSSSKYHSGDLLTRITSDINAVTGGITSVFPMMVSLIVRFASAFITLMIYEPRLSIFALVLGPAAVFASRALAKGLKQIQIKVQESESAYRSYMQETFVNLTIIKTFCYQDEAIDNLQLLQDDRMKWIMKRNRISMIAGMALSAAYWLSYIVAFGWGSLQMAAGLISFGTMTAFLQLVQQIQTPIINLSRTIPHIISISASAERIMDIENLTAEETAGNVRINIGKALGIEMRNVSFGYDEHSLVLDKANLSVKPGEFVALKGSSGIGKTTLVRLLLSLIKQNEGEIIFFDEYGNKTAADPLVRESIAYVPQGNTLFSGTIRANLLIGSPSATDKDIEDSLKMACAWKFISELPEGIYTTIGEKGLGLSEGQAQRIAIARALIRKAPLLILDEATSALDSETEKEIIDNMKKYQKIFTTLVITHRKAAMDLCDRQINMENGKII